MSTTVVERTMTEDEYIHDTHSTYYAVNVTVAQQLLADGFLSFKKENKTHIVKPPRKLLHANGGYDASVIFDTLTAFVKAKDTANEKNAEEAKKSNTKEAKKNGIIDVCTEFPGKIFDDKFVVIAAQHNMPLHMFIDASTSDDNFIIECHPHRTYGHNVIMEFLTEAHAFTSQLDGINSIEVKVPNSSERIAKKHSIMYHTMVKDSGFRASTNIHEDNQFHWYTKKCTPVSRF